MRPYKLVLVLLQFIFIDVISSQNECPAFCKCTGEEAKCIHQDLLDLPIVPAGIRTLDLGYNKIGGIPTGALSSYEKLQNLLLNGNEISELHTGCFKEVFKIVYLYLYRNRLRVIDSDVFANRTNLKQLYLHDNEIRRIPEACFSELPHLRRLRLEGNPLVCDCALAWLAQMAREYPNKNIAAFCHLPTQIKGKLITGFMDGYMCKPPVITMEPDDVKVREGDNVYMVCIANGVPDPKISWFKNNVKLPERGPRHHIIGDNILMLINNNLTDSGSIVCQAKNIDGVATSRAAQLTVLEHIPEKPTFEYFSGDVVLHPGEKQSVMNCYGNGNPHPHASWYFNGDRILLDNHIAVHKNGSLIIEPVTQSDVGTYTCQLENIHGLVKANATLTILSKPTIMEVPDRQSVIVGDLVMLKCQVLAEPLATITWHNNDKLLSSDENVIITDEGSTLTIKQVTLAHNGRYTCTAANTQGFAQRTFTVEVSEYSPTPPRIISKPESLETFQETIVQFPCEVESDAPTIIEWRKDGLELTPNNRTIITLVGSLVITNVTFEDAGTYQCKAYNDFGRETASATLKVKENILPREEFINVALTEALNDVDDAINKTMEALFNKNKGKVDLHDYFRISRFPNAPARDIARAAEIYERTLIKVRQYMENGLKLESVDQFQYDNFISPKHLDLIARLSGCTAHREDRNCSDTSYHYQYRTIDGSCNNLAEPLWGSSLTAFRRILPPIYENGFSEPVGWNRNLKYNGYVLPSARLVSNKLLSTINITEDLSITHMTMQWGQWLDHDLDHALPSVSSRTWDGVDCKKTCENAAPCFPIDVPENDPRIKDRRCIDFIRTSSVCGSGYTSVLLGKLQAREQINQLTSYLDASQVYGFEYEVAKDLRDLTNDKGLLRVGASLTRKKPFLPTIGTNGMDCRRNLEESSRNCFVAGDIRANEQVGLAAMHTIWMREHNKIATQLKKINPFWSGDKVYQEARKIVGAEMQFITYEQWLPLILGPEGFAQFGSYKGYNATLNPSVSNVFATAALRFGHSLINPVLHRLDENFEPIAKGHLLLRHAFFSPWRLADEGGVDPLIRGMFVTPAKLKTPSQNLNSELTENLFHTAHAVALDLAAINIQRSREHGIPFYTKWREFCNMTPVNTFDDLKNEITTKEVRDKLKELYGSPHNIDVFVGGILEDQVAGGKVGPLFRCLLTEQFTRLRDGDRLWYENPSTFKPQQLEQIKLTSLARILCDNGDTIDTISENVFLLPETQDGLVACDDIPAMDLQHWTEFDNCVDCEDDYDLQ